MATHVRVFLLVSALLLLPAAVSADVFCIPCKKPYRAPGGANGESIGIVRVDGCPVCKDPDCKEAAKLAAQLKKDYRDLRSSYQQYKKQLEELARGGKTVSASDKERLEKMKADLGAMEKFYADLYKACPDEVKNPDIWKGLQYEGQPYTGPVVNQPTSAADQAKQTAGNYKQIAKSEQQQIDTIIGFFGAAQRVGETVDGYSPPQSGYNGERYKATRSYQDLAGAHSNEAQMLANDRAGKRDPKADLKKAIEPQFPEIKIAKGGEAYIRNAGIAARTRVEGSIYARAGIQAREMYRQSLATGNMDAAKLHALSAVEFAWQAQGYARWAADHQHKSDVVHQKKLDESLAAAAEKGLTLPVLLEKFQTQVKKSGLPAHLDDALTTSGASDEERTAVKARLLAQTPEAVEAVLKERRARISRGAEVPDAVILDSQLLTSQQEYHKLVKK